MADTKMRADYVDSALLSPTSVPTTRPDNWNPFAIPLGVGGVLTGLSEVEGGEERPWGLTEVKRVEFEVAGRAARLEHGLAGHLQQRCLISCLSAHPGSARQRRGR